MTKSGKPNGTNTPERQKEFRDIPDPRAKSRKHKKTTADKWNQ